MIRLSSLRPFSLVLAIGLTFTLAAQPRPTRAPDALDVAKRTEFIRPAKPRFPFGAALSSPTGVVFDSVGSVSDQPGFHEFRNFFVGGEPDHNAASDVIEEARPFPYKRFEHERWEAYSSLSPLDNSIAVGENGWIASVNNGSMDVQGPYDPVPVSLKKFFGAMKVPGDPKVIYDEGKKHFIAFAQECDDRTKYDSAQVMVAISEGPDPTKRWFFYRVTVGYGVQFDYPKVALTSSGLFVSGSLFKRDEDEPFSAVVCQFDLAQGYHGKAMRYVVWKEFNDGTLFTMPVTSGEKDLYGPGCFMISANWGNPSKAVKLYYVPGDLTNAQERMVRYDIERGLHGDYGHFRMPVQQGGYYVHTLDLRIMDGFLLADDIVFVFTAGDQAGRSCVDLNVLNLPSLSLRSRTLGDKGGRSYCYPSVSWMKRNDGGVVLFNQYQSLGPGALPDVRCKACNLDLTCWPEETIAVGTGPVAGPEPEPNLARWGDYTTIAREPGGSGRLVLAASLPDEASKLWSVVTQVVPAESDAPALTWTFPAFVTISSSDWAAFWEANQATDQQYRILLEGDILPSNLFTGALPTGTERVNIFLPEGAYKPGRELAVKPVGSGNEVVFRKEITELKLFNRDQGTF